MTATAYATAMRVDGLIFGYRADTPVIEGLSAELGVGRLTALIGPNAAGKSTLLKLMLGQLEPWSGRVMLGDRPVDAMVEIERAAAISYVPQRGALSFAFTVRQVVAMGRFAVGRDDRALEAALEACDLSGLSDRVYAQLSGGQQQRVLLARAMAQAWRPPPDPGGRVMLLDEPTASADLWHIHRTMGRLRDLAAAGLAVLVVLHDLNLASRYADDVWLMDEGHLLAADAWDAVMRPEVLEPAYRVSLRALAVDGSDRPVFVVEPGGCD